MEVLLIIALVALIAKWIASPEWVPATKYNVQPGDLVRFKSGGPEMTVVVKYTDSVVCTWWKVDVKLPPRDEFCISTLLVKK